MKQPIQKPNMATSAAIPTMTVAMLNKTVQFIKKLTQAITKNPTANHWLNCSCS